MIYDKLNFENGSPPAINATALNHIETGISEAAEAITQLEADVENKANSATTLEGYGITDGLANGDGTVKLANLAQDILDYIVAHSNGEGGGVTLTQVQTLLADYAKSSELDNKEDVSNRVTSITQAFTDESGIKYPTVLALLKYLEDYYYNFEDIYAAFDGIRIDDGNLIVLLPDGEEKSLGSVNGSDYILTDDDKAEIATEIKVDLSQLTPEFANTIDECTDTSKVYVLPDGYIYAYIKTAKSTVTYTNLADPTDENWKDGYRFSSSGESAKDGTTISNIIPCAKGDIVRVKGITLTENQHRIAVTYTNAETLTESNAYGYINAPATVGGYALWAYAVEDDVYMFTIQTDTPHTITGIRFAMPTPADASAVIVTVNEEITDPVTTNDNVWTNTGHAFVPTDYEDRIIAAETTIAEQAETINDLQSKVEEFENDVTASEIPEYWEEHIDSKIAIIKALQRTGGKDCFSFVLMTDIHYPSNLGKCSPLLAKKIMDECSIKYAICAGDVQTRGCHSTKEELLAENENIEKMFSPIRNKLLQIEGNHDGAYATVDSVTYACQLMPEEMFEEIYRKVGVIGGVNYLDAGCAYYIDDISNKVRYIGLNTHCVPYEETENGTAKYNKFRALNFTQSQFDFLTNEALTDGLTDKWSVVIFGHIYIHEGQNDFALMSNLLSAYQNKTTYIGTYTGTADNGYDAVSVDADFTNAKGNLIGYFCGHKHVDEVYSASDVKVILTRCDGAEENDSTLKAERVAGTVTEQSFDVFTVNKATRTIYATKIGAGDDREISY